MFQKVLQQILQNCPGVKRIMGDVMVHVPSEEEHETSSFIYTSLRKYKAGTKKSKPKRLTFKHDVNFEEARLSHAIMSLAFELSFMKNVQMVQE